MAAIVMLHEPLRRAAHAFTGRDHARLLLAPASLRKVDPMRLEVLKRRYLAATRLLAQPAAAHPDSAQLAGLRLVRDALTAAVVDTVTHGVVRRDHLARQMQTPSMARIERSVTTSPWLNGALGAAEIS